LQTEVFVASGQGMVEERLQLCTQLWAAGFSAVVGALLPTR
jgi:hypothetical protein